MASRLSFTIWKLNARLFCFFVVVTMYTVKICNYENVTDKREIETFFLNQDSQKLRIITEYSATNVQISHPRPGATLSLLEK